MRRRRHLPLLLLASLLLDGCTGLGYYLHVARGGLAVSLRKRPITRVLRDPATPPDLAARLRLVLAVREFAERDMALPANGSYRGYAALDRPYAAWNVTAAGELSIEPVTWCFPVAGCVSYRGYFSERRARRFAERLERRGLETDVGGVTAYSTLGWLRDPVLSTFVHLPEPELAGLVFHELAHQRVYLKGDTPFNESFATVVETEGVRRWLEARGRAEEFSAFRRDRARWQEVVDLMLDYRQRLGQVYAGEIPPEEKRRRKTELFAALRHDYERLTAVWEDAGRWSTWLDGVNNARLASIAAYHQHVPAFEALLRDLDGDLDRFYQEVVRLARADRATRDARLSRPPAPLVDAPRRPGDSS